MYIWGEGYLAGGWVRDSDETNVVDVGVREVIPGGRNPDVDLAGQVGQLRVAMPKVGDHIIQRCTTKSTNSEPIQPCTFLWNSLEKYLLHIYTAAWLAGPECSTSFLCVLRRVMTVHKICRI